MNRQVTTRLAGQVCGIRCGQQTLARDSLAQAETGGTLGAAFGTGTAARIARITAIGDGQREIRFRETGVVETLHAALKRAQESRADDRRGWCETVEPLRL